LARDCTRCGSGISLGITRDDASWLATVPAVDGSAPGAASVALSQTINSFLLYAIPYIEATPDNLLENQKHAHSA
jgi:hypothetical protein